MTSLAGQLDPRRYFTAAEITAAWLRQDRRCNDCRREVPRDLVEGDHIVAWSAGGLTDLDNLQALCVACNRRKGHRPGEVATAITAGVRVAQGPLRIWQDTALEVVASRQDPLLFEACPGAGKTCFGLEAAARMIDTGEVNRVLIVAPTRQIVEQWVEASNGSAGGPIVPLAPADWRPTQPLFARWCGAVFTYQALYSQTTMFEALAAEPGFKTLVIFDEVHHVGTDSAWGISSQQAFLRAAGRILSLSGTAFRTKDPIVFVRTVEGRAIPDYAYTYGDALTDGICRPVRFALVGGSTTFRTPSGSVETVTFSDDLNDRGESYRLRTALEPSGGHVSMMLDIADAEVRRLRADGDVDAAVLVVCMDCDHADAIASLITQRTGQRPVVAYSRTNNPDDPAPRPALAAFGRGTSPWLVAVRMASEGFDARRLRVLVHATNVVTELSFRQLVGRVVRSDPTNGDDDYGIVVLPNDPRLAEMADRVRAEAPLRIVSPLVISDPKTRATFRTCGNRL